MLEVGDKVRIKSIKYFKSLSHSERHRESHFTEPMEDDCDKTGKIISKRKAESSNGAFNIYTIHFLNEDYNSGWNWNKWMFDKINEIDKNGNYLLEF